MVHPPTPRVFLAYAASILLAASLTGCNSKTGSMEATDVAARAITTNAMPNNAMAMEPPSEANIFNTESYDHIEENEFLSSLQHPKSTFSVDVDTASYSNVRRMLRSGTKPPAGAVRIEELINYFSYNYPKPDGDHPFSVSMEVAPCPWEPEHELLRIGLKGYEIDLKERPASNLVFLLDVSGSMRMPDKLPLVKSAMKLLLEQLDERDRIAIAVYAGGSGLALPSTPASEKAKILAAIDQLQAGGSTNGAQGIHLAYNVAQSQFIAGGINRVILCTDGDFNVGVTNQSQLVELIEEKAKSKVFLTVFGFGTGNLKDSTMEKLADHGNGMYAYIDSLLEARKSLVRQIGGTLITIAKDVKIQLDFNPQHVAAYRLIGCENRLLANEDFQDDTKDAGEIGAGHSVTALYELVPPGVESPSRKDTPSQFVKTVVNDDVDNDTMLTIGLRYKKPEGESSIELNETLYRTHSNTDAPSADMRFASSVAAFGMLLRDSKFKGNATWDAVIETAQAAVGEDQDGFRSEFIELAKKARLISGA